ncbi:MAG: hypothetical protein ACFFC7_20105 [Candidatus Hermodarchaeota archaeon]
MSKKKNEKKTQVPEPMLQLVRAMIPLLLLFCLLWIIVYIITGKPLIL